jgi:uncharacterized protein (DUF2236 family)
VLLGWTRAILLQLAHPLIAAGVYDHSTFRATPWAAASRLHATVRAMLALTFGTDAERQYALHGIRTIHRRVNGTLSETVGPFSAGTRYSAEDPALVLWVHLTLLESVPLAYELFVEPLSDGDRDEYCDQAAWTAIALGAVPADVPRTWSDARARLDAMYASGTLVVGRQARELGEVVLAPRISRLVPPLASLNRTIATGLLPAPIRDQYELKWDSREQQRFDKAARRLRRLRRALPNRLALWPDART